MSVPSPSLRDVRMIHTSDWHLGRSFHQVGLLDAQAAFVDHLVDTVRAEAVDAVLVSGDVYDRALPAPDTVALLSEAVTRLIDAGAQVVLSSGNHDSAIRLGFASGLLERSGLHIRSATSSIGRPVLVDDVAIYPLPYLEPSIAAGPLGAAERTHAGVLTAAMDRVNADRSARGGRSVVMAHAFVNGGATSDSERDITVGGVAMVHPRVFDGRRLRRSGPPARPAAGRGDHPLQRLPGGHCPSARRATPRGPGSSTSGRPACAVEQVAAPVLRPLAVLRGELARPAATTRPR